MTQSTLRPEMGEVIAAFPNRCMLSCHECGTRGSNVMRTGADYRKSLRDGRRVWIMGEGLIEDVATHPATRAVVDEYVAWYDRHADPAWTDTVLTPDGTPISCLLPTSADDLVRMGKCFSATTFLSAGNITHTPAYGHLISL